MKNLVTILFFFLFIKPTQGQYFQKAFGIISPNQQELYSLNRDSDNIYTSGTLKNFNYFPELNFWGTLSKLSSDATIIWSKAYLPNDANTFDSMFINSIQYIDDNSIYGFGTYLGTAETSGYYLIKFNSSGSVLWAKFIRNEVQTFSDLIIGNNAIYAVLLDKIIKFDFNGNVINSVKIDLEFNINLRKSCLTDSGNIVVTGDAIINSTPGMPVLTFNQNLDLVSGYFYSKDLNGSLFGNAIAVATNDKIIIGASDNIVCIDSLTGELLWSKIINNIETPTSLDGLVNLIDIQPLNAEKTQFYTTFSANYFDDQINLFYIVNANVDALGNFSQFKAIKRTPFNSIDNYQIPYSLSVDLVDNSYFISGSLSAQDQTSENEYHLNYLHKGNLNELSCGEETISQNLIVPDNSSIYLNIFPSSLVVPATVTVISKTLNVEDLILDYNNLYCLDPILSTPHVGFLEIQIAPNPVQDILSVQSNQAVKQIMVYDMLGKLIEMKRVTANSIDVSQLSKGIYMIKLTSDSNQVFVSKFVKE